MDSMSINIISPDEEVEVEIPQEDEEASVEEGDDKNDRLVSQQILISHPNVFGKLSKNTAPFPETLKIKDKRFSCA